MYDWLSVAKPILRDTGLPRRHALGLEHADGFRCLEIVEESLGGCRVLALGSDRAHENQFLLQVARERSRELDAGRDQHIREKDPELDLAFGDRLRDGTGCRLRLVLSLICSAMPSHSNVFCT